MVMWWYALWDVYIYCSLMLFSLLVWSWGVFIWDIWLNHFWVLDLVYLGCFPVASIGLKCLLCFFMMSCCDMFDFIILSCWSVLLGYFLVAHWEPMDSVIYLWCFLVSRRGLMWLLWIIFWCFPVTCIGMRWFYYDFFIYDFMSLG